MGGLLHNVKNIFNQQKNNKKNKANIFFYPGKVGCSGVKQWLV